MPDPKPHPKLSIIAAVTRNGVIGRDNTLPWRLKDDLKRFKSMTTGHTLIMGRLTFESFGNGALPNRRNIVVTHREDFSPANVEIAHSIKAAFELCRGDDEVFIIGGASVYADTLPVVDRMYITHIDAEVEGDAVFPWFDVRGWDVNVLEMAPADENNEYATSFVRYDRVLEKLREPLG